MSCRFGPLIDPLGLTGFIWSPTEVGALLAWSQYPVFKVQAQRSLTLVVVLTTVNRLFQPISRGFSVPRDAKRLRFPRRRRSRADPVMSDSLPCSEHLRFGTAFQDSSVLGKYLPRQAAKDRLSPGQHRCKKQFRRISGNLPCVIASQTDKRSGHSTSPY